MKDENDLDPDALYYVRSKSVPTILIHGRTGDGYRRADGKEWPFDGLKSVRNETGQGGTSSAPTTRWTKP